MDHHPVLIVDATGVIRHWSAGAENVFGYSADRAVGQTLDLIVPPDFREAHWRGFRAAIVAGSAQVEGQTQPFPVRCRDGNVTLFPGTITLLRNAQRQVLGVIAIFEPAGDSREGR